MTYAPAVPNRPQIPAQMKRDVLIESGYRCAIPQCGQIQFDIHHIVPWATVHEHTFDNLIALCANCHRRVTNGEIDGKAIKQIKANLAVLGNRYGELERRYLREVAARGAQAGTVIMLSGGLDLLMANLVADGIVAKGTADVLKIEWDEPGIPDFPMAEPYMLTTKGREFVGRWFEAEALDE
jgi:hypothetical protein